MMRHHLHANKYTLGWCLLCLALVASLYLAGV